MYSKPDILIIGAGLTGLTAATYLARNGLDVLVVERKGFIGGLCKDDYTKIHRVLYHKYGVHVFHTNDYEVWDFLSDYTDWYHYQHQTKAWFGGRFFTIPIPSGGEFGEKEEDLKVKLYYEYEKKMWGKDHLKIPSGKRIQRDDLVLDYRYFTDKYQGIPRPSYTKMFENMIFDSNYNGGTIKILLNKDYNEFEKFTLPTVYTGMIPGTENLHLKMSFTIYETLFQEKARYPVINFPTDYDYIRQTDYGLLLNQSNKYTAIGRDYPRKDYIYFEYCYPITMPSNIKAYNKAKKKFLEQHPHVILAGRFGQFKYMNMDEAVRSGLNVAKKILEGKKE